MTSRTALALALLIACKPDPAVGHRRAADELLQRSEFAGAAAEYAKSLALDPKQEKVWEKLAFCRVKTGEKDLAAKALEELADLKVDAAQKADVYRNAAGLFLQGTEREKAEKYLLEIVRLEPGDEASLTWLGELASERGGARHQLGNAVPDELEKAIGYYDRLLALKPDSPAAHVNRRIVLLKYLAHLDERRRLESAGLRRAGRDAAAAARERIARIDATSAELRRKLEESSAKLAGPRKPPVK